MAPPTKYHRFRSGERCDECGARQWYAENALRYCRNGHRLEGFAAHEEDEDAFGTRGRVSRKKREPKSAKGASHQAVKLSGDAGRELYLEVLQLVLRRQIRALGGLLGLIRGGGGGGDEGGAASVEAEEDAGMGGDDLEHVVRSLWVLRVRNLPLKLEGSSSNGGKGRKGGRSAGESGEESGREGASSRGGFSSSGFSSGSLSELESSDYYSDASRATTARSWDPDARARWKLPKLVDALALCYLACLVKRLPVTTADFHRWAQRGDIEFLAAINSIPKNVRDRLPAEYHRALQVKDHIKTGYLQTTVQQLIFSFHVNFDLVFPPLNYVPILIQHIKELLLPVETYPAAKSMAEVMKADFTYPHEGKRIRSMRNPEVLLITLVVVAAKLLYSLDGVERAPRSDRDFRCLKPDWAAWREAIEDKARRKSTTHLEQGQEYKVTPNDALTMDNTKLDDYMDWFEKMWTGGDTEPGTAEALREPFVDQKRATSPRPHKTSEEEGSDAETTRRYRTVNRRIKVVEVVPDASDEDEENTRQPRDFCPVWRSEEDLPDIARMLYREAAERAAIPLVVLVRAAAQVERCLEVWCMQRAKERRREKGKGKATEVLGVTDSDE